MNEDKYTKGFNRGYILRQAEPELLDAMIKGIQTDTDFTKGLKDGSRQMEKEIMKEAVKALNRQTSKDRGRER